MDLLSQQLMQQKLAIGGCQVDSQEMGEVAASWEAKRGSIKWGVLHATKSWKHGIMDER
jgi:hypothetical protein